MKSNNKKLNILFVVPTLGRGGAETQLIDLVNAVDPVRFNKTIVAFDENIDQISRIDKQSVDFCHFSRSNKYDISVFWKLARLIDKKEIDVIHCTLQVSMLVAKIAVLLAKRTPRVILAIHATVTINRKYELADRYIYRYLMRYCHRIIFVCRKQADYWVGKFPELKTLSVVIYNGVDINSFNRQKFVAQGVLLKKKLDIPEDVVVITCIASLRKVKGHQYLIEAFSCLPENVYLLLVGDGDIRTIIEKQVKDKHLESRVRFLGGIADVRPVLAATNVAVLSSISETFSMAMLESMSMEVPVVATDVGGLSEAIKPGETGDLVLPKDVAALKRALLCYVNDRSYAACVGTRARHMVIEKFSKEAMVKQTEKVLLGVLHEYGGKD